MEMRARVCDLLGKTGNRQARVVTFSHKRIKKVQQVNLQWKRFASDALGRSVRLRLSTKGIKTVNKMGSIDAAAKKFGVDLTKSYYIIELDYFDVLINKICLKLI